jgi:hypothetical protein
MYATLPPISRQKDIDEQDVTSEPAHVAEIKPKGTANLSADVSASLIDRPCRSDKIA